MVRSMVNPLSAEHPQGWPIPLVLSEVWRSCLCLVGADVRGEFVACGTNSALSRTRFHGKKSKSLPSACERSCAGQSKSWPRRPDVNNHSLFDYELMRSQCTTAANKRCQLNWAGCRAGAHLSYGQLGGRIGAAAAAGRPLLVGAVKRPTLRHLHTDGYRTILQLRPGQRTPYLQATGTGGGRQADLPLVSWYLKLSGGPQLVPNWGFIRVDVPLVQFERIPQPERRGFVDRLSRG